MVAIFYFILFFVCLLFYRLENSYSNIAPSQVAHCNSQRHLVPSSSSVSKTACNAFYPPSTNSVCSYYCGPTPYSNQFLHHSSIPHSKSLDHYNNESAKFSNNHNASRHSFDQPNSYASNYKIFDCIDGGHVSDRSNGIHYNSAGVGIYHQPSCSQQNTGNLHNLSGNRYALPTTIPFPDHHYSQISGFDRGENFVEPSMSACCHQNSHYECLNNFNSRNSHQKPKNGIDYSNCSFQSK